MVEVNLLSCLVSERCANLNSILHNSVNFQPIFTNEVSKPKLRIFLSMEIKFVYFSDFSGKLFFSKLVHIFWKTLQEIKFPFEFFNLLFNAHFSG